MMFIRESKTSSLNGLKKLKNLSKKDLILFRESSLYDETSGLQIDVTLLV